VILKLFPKIAIIGAGKVGISIGIGLSKKGYEIVGVSDNNKEHALRCLRLTNTKFWSANPSDVAKLADIVFLTLPDSVIQKVAREILPSLKLDKVLIHTSGALPSDMLPKKKRIKRLSMHPIHSFADIDNIKGTYWGLEGDKDAVEMGKNIVKDLGGMPIELNKADKALYHAGILMGGPYLLVLINAGISILENTGAKDGLQVLLPLIKSALQNLEKMGIKDAVTGPIKRGDIETVKKEIESLSKKAPQFLPIYKTLGLLKLNMLGDDDLQEEIKNELKSLLNND
jgi:predicted short-subunit dehydrogenase-like oxidoreductase (DUF2520 family)